MQIVYEFCAKNHLPDPQFDNASAQDSDLFCFKVCSESLANFCDSISANRAQGRNAQARVLLGRLPEEERREEGRCRACTQMALPGIRSAVRCMSTSGAAWFCAVPSFHLSAFVVQPPFFYSYWSSLVCNGPCHQVFFLLSHCFPPSTCIIHQGVHMFSTLISPSFPKLRRFKLPSPTQRGIHQL